MDRRNEKARRVGYTKGRRGLQSFPPPTAKSSYTAQFRSYYSTFHGEHRRTSLVSSLLVCVCVCVQPESKQHAIHYVSIGDYGSGNCFTVGWNHFVMSEVWRVVEFFCAMGKVSLEDMKFRCYFTDWLTMISYSSFRNEPNQTIRKGNS